MTSPDLRTFIDKLAGGHQSWHASHPSPTGSESFDHDVADETHTAGLLRTYRSEHGYTRVRPFADAFLPATSTTAVLQGYIASVGAVGQAFRSHWFAGGRGRLAALESHRRE